MVQDRLKIWETLFQRALALIDSVAKTGASFEPWTFGGGTVLMRKYRHRFSKDIDIFVPDPQYLGYVTPRLSDTAESMTSDYVEQGNFVKLLFPEGEIDFIASAALTPHPFTIESLFGREARVETATEIIAKKVWHRGKDFRARDLFDLALVAEREPEALKAIEPILLDRRKVVLARIADADKQLRSEFSELEVLDFQPSYDECLAIVRKILGGR
jgi:predicted nucleotidyltransferase component of viral defense system